MSADPYRVMADDFMKRKGLEDLQPFDRDDAVDDCAYFYYDLPQGVLELEVFWNGTDWEVGVTSFPAEI